jgi:hypothetical protein
MSTKIRLFGKMHFGLYIEAGPQVGMRAKDFQDPLKKRSPDKNPGRC